MPRLTGAQKSAKRPGLFPLKPLWTLVSLSLALLGCSSASDHGALAGLGNGGPTEAPPAGGGCSTPNQGCACETTGALADCGQVERVSGEYVSCSLGRRSCENGKWGACVGDSVATLHVPAGRQRTQGLGSGMDCTDNPCDPYCRLVVDSPDDLPLPDGGALTNDGGLQLVPSTSSGAGACTSMVVKPTPQAVTITGFASSAGLLGEFYAQIDTQAAAIPSTWTRVATRTDPKIDFDFPADPLPAGIDPAGTYSIRWTGTLVPPTSEPYTFCTTTDDGSRLWIDGEEVVDKWYDRAAAEFCGTPRDLVAGSTHSIRLEFYQDQGLSSAQLLWSTPSIAKQVVPASAFTASVAQQPILNAIPKFQVELNPPGCLPGDPKPAWTLDRLDIATIDPSGTVALTGAVAGPINVTAYLGSLSASGVLNVTTDIADTSAAPAGSVTKFQGAAAGTDNARILYPYDQTVFPIGLGAPRIQWDNTASGASAVKVSLRYPVTGAAAFSWSEIIAESSPPQAIIPPTIWRAFEQTAKGQAAGLSVQRIVSGQAKLPANRLVNFSTAPVRGKIYYTQYARMGAGPGQANEMVANPSSGSPAVPAFGTTDGCPGCHTMSANGNVFATSSRVGLLNGSYNLTISPTLGGVSTVNSNGSLTPIADFVGSPSRATYTAGSTDWRGFAWAPLTPDGVYALAANNIWGNTKETLVGINGTTRQVNTGTVMQSGGSGTGLLAQYFPSTNYTGAAWKRIDPQLNFDFGAASPGGLIPVDFSVKRSGQIQAYFTQTYHFEVVTTSSDSFALTVGTTSVAGSGPATLTADMAMNAGALVPFELDQINSTGSSNVQVYWSSPSTPRALIPQPQLYLPASEPVHGANVVYRDTASGTTASVIEPDIASNWGAHNPAAGIAPDNWTSTWDAKVESPYAGAVELCLDSDEGVTLSVDGGPLLVSSATSYTGCVAAGTWSYGELHAVHIVHTDLTGNAQLILKYKYGAVTEVIPSTNLYPINAAPPTSGLTATYYDSAGFNSALPASQTNPRAFQRIDPNIDFDWQAGRPNYSTISDDDKYSARWTGHITLPCDGVYEFATNGNVNDGGRLWIDDQRVMARWNAGALSGAGWFKAGSHDFKFDWFEDTGNAVAKLQWNTPCTGSPGWVTIPNGAFTPNASYGRTTGFVIDGGDNGNNTNYWVWQLPTVMSPTPVDVTGDSAGNWGLAGNAMMVPSFSPDGTKLVFIDGDSAGGAGWRKGLSTFDFDRAGKAFKNRRLITSTWPLGDALKWPAFEADSRSVIFQSTVPGDECCRTPPSSYAKYGYMAPTNYYEDPGRLWSVDTTAANPSPVALTALNSGEQALDANKSYQPTMLPVAAGGYRWVVFTSTRPYGNTLNLPAVQQDFSDTSTYASSSYSALDYTKIQSQLWVAAIDDSPSAGADRSHPAFWLPSQNYSATAANGYVNERGYWVLDACHPVGADAASQCDGDEDCCGASGPSKNAACRLDTPVGNPPTRHCQALPPMGQCVAETESCSATSDCCTGLVCAGASCVTPPPVSGFAPENYERIYQSDCPEGTKVVWRFFDWQTVTPETDSRLEIFAESQADPTLFATLPVAPYGITDPTVVSVHIVTGAPTTTWTGSEIEALLEAQMLKSQEYLKITVRFVPNTELTASPILKNWRQSYSCVPGE